MRFIPDGPDIPLPLIRRWRDGNVLFLTGAGVSTAQPSNLPLFEGLVLDVYKELRDPLYKTLCAAKAKTNHQSRDAILQSADLQPKERVEANLFFAKEFDRLFSALEARIDQDPLGRMISRRVRDAVEARLRCHGGPAQGHRDLVRLSVVSRAAHQPGPGEQCRIVTTNFDLLLEEAWAAELASGSKGYDARMAPRPGSYNFEGVVHLHGLLDDNPHVGADIVLSSRDFARVYLRSGAVGNYVYDLVRRYMVVLIGYSADDPTMRYLMDAIGEDAALFMDMNRPYVVAARNDGVEDPDGEIDSQTWRVKNIEPILYTKRRSGAAHAPLWETLNAWAEWQRRGHNWVIEQLLTATALPPSVEEDFSSAFVRDVLQVLDREEQAYAIHQLSEARVPFSWIEIVEQASALKYKPSDAAK